MSILRSKLLTRSGIEIVFTCIALMPLSTLAVLNDANLMSSAKEKRHSDDIKEDEKTKAASDANASLANREERMVVTATTTVREESRAPASISVVSKEEIEATPVNSISEVIKRVPGAVGGVSSVGEQSRIGLRGLPSKYTLILVDGKRIDSSQLLSTRYARGNNAGDTPGDLNWIDPSIIERIEVVRGPMSTLYGSDAMGGVINIITKKIQTKWNASSTTNYNKMAKSKGHGTRGDVYQYSAMVSGPLTDTLGVRLNYNQRRKASDEISLKDMQGRDGYSTTQVAGGFLDRGGDILLNYNYDNENSFDVEYSRSERKNWGSNAKRKQPQWGKPTINNIVGSPGFANITRERWDLGYKGSSPLMSTEANLYVTQYKSQNFNKKDIKDLRNFKIFNSTGKNITFDGKISKTLDFPILNVLSMGTQLRHEYINNPDAIGGKTNTSSSSFIPVLPDQTIDGKRRTMSSKVSSHSYALFMQDEAFLTESLSATTGIRADYVENYSVNYTPRVYLVYSPLERWTIKGGVSKGYKVGDLTDRTNTVFQGMGGACAAVQTGSLGNSCIVVGNPNLKPEKSTTWEISGGYDYQGWRVNLTYWDTQFVDKIQNIYIGTKDKVDWVMPANVKRARTRGIEAGVTLPLFDNLTLNSTATRVFESKVYDTIPEYTAFSRAPSFTNYTTVDWDIKDNIRLSWAGNYQRRDATKTFSMATALYPKSNFSQDVYMRYLLNKEMTLNFGVKNVFNKTPRDKGGQYPESDPRSYFIGVNAYF